MERVAKASRDKSMGLLCHLEASTSTTLSGGSKAACPTDVVLSWDCLQDLTGGIRLEETQRDGDDHGLTAPVG